MGAGRSIDVGRSAAEQGSPAGSSPPRRLKYELCVESAIGVRAALRAGVDRIELCRDLCVGGLTPGSDAIDEALSLAGANLGVHVLVRSRPGDFVYTAEEIATMVDQIERAVAAGASGVVVGALTPEGVIDEQAMATFMAAARPASVTFHRAFDEVPGSYAGYARLADLGVDRVLTGGGVPNALEGAERLRQLVDRSAAGPIVLVGGGVTSSNAASLVSRTGARELHFSARRAGAPSPAGTEPEGEEPLAARARAIISAAEVGAAGRG